MRSDIRDVKSLQGKRIDADYFVDDVMEGYTEGCNYLMAVDIDMNTVDGYAMSSWDSGYGDMVMRPDLSTLHRVPWQPGTVGVLCDLETEEGDPVAPSPRQVLRRQLDALSAAGYQAFVGTELEFIVFQDTYEEAWLAGYRGKSSILDRDIVREFSARHEAVLGSSWALGWDTPSSPSSSGRYFSSQSFGPLAARCRF